MQQFVSFQINTRLINNYRMDLKQSTFVFNI